MRGRRRVGMGGVVLTATLAIAGCMGEGVVGGSGQAACEAPTIDTTEIASAGEVVELTGHGFGVCHDNLVFGEPVPTPEGLPPMPVMWRQGDVEVELATATPAADGTIELEVTIPADAQPGPAELIVEIAVAPLAVR